MKKNEKEIVAEEALTLKLYPRETKTVSLEISVETLEVLERKAKEKDLPLKALLKFYIGQGLRNDLSKKEAAELALKRIETRKHSPPRLNIDLAA